ncbi:MAG: sensor domain-containing diguanylate cyclase [Pseudothermotoga sp.]
MKKTVMIFLSSLVIFIACTLLLYNLNLKDFKKRVQVAQVVINGAANFIASTLSHSFFISDAMYEAVLNDLQTYIQKKLEEIKKDYPHVLSASIRQVDPQMVEKMQDFQISFAERSLQLVLKIYDEDHSRYLPNRIASVIVDLQGLLDSLGFSDIEVCEEGNFTILGLNCRSKKPFLKTQDYLVSFFISLTVIILIRWLNIRRAMRLETKYKEELLRKTRLHEALLKFTELILSGQSEEASQYILERAVECVPGAQAGSLLMKKGDLFVFTNVCGYDEKFVGKMFFRVEELAQSMDKKEVKIIRNLHQLNAQNLDEERKKFLYSDERVSRIKVLLSIPVVVHGEIIAFFNLDNFENENAFDERSIQMAKLLAGQVGLLFERIRLEEELKEQREKLEHLSYHDPLTGLPNRRLLEEHAERLFALAQREEKSICLVFVDLYKFKEVNDTFGHSVGDQVLKMIAQRIQRLTRKNDSVARLGGDEFVFLLYDSDAEDSAAFARRLLSIIREPIVVQNISFSISANMGMAFFPTDGNSFETLLRNADMALYIAKRKRIPFAFYKDIT